MFSWISKNKGSLVTVVIIVAILLVMVAWAGAAQDRKEAYFKKKHQQQDIADEAVQFNTFKDWTKYTGNKSLLTYKEWKRLKNANLLGKHSK